MQRNPTWSASQVLLPTPREMMLRRKRCFWNLKRHKYTGPLHLLSLTTYKLISDQHSPSSSIQISNLLPALPTTNPGGDTSSLSRHSFQNQKAELVDEAPEHKPKKRWRQNGAVKAETRKHEYLDGYSFCEVRGVQQYAQSGKTTLVWLWQGKQKQQKVSYTWDGALPVPNAALFPLLLPHGAPRSNKITKRSTTCAVPKCQLWRTQGIRKKLQKFRTRSTSFVDLAVGLNFVSASEPARLQYLLVRHNWFVIELAHFHSTCTGTSSTLDYPTQIMVCIYEFHIYLSHAQKNIVIDSPYFLLQGLCQFILLSKPTTMYIFWLWDSFDCDSVFFT